METFKKWFWFILNIVIFLGILLWGGFGYIRGREMGFVFMNFYIIMPLTSFVCGFFTYKNLKLLSILQIIVVGALGFLIPYLLFRNYSLVLNLLIGAIPSTVGVILGAYRLHAHETKDRKNHMLKEEVPPTKNMEEAPVDEAEEKIDENL